MSSQNILEQFTSLVHIKPSYDFVPIVFNDDMVSNSNCKYKNKYGEYVCKEERKCGVFCDEHNREYNKFYSLLKYLIKKCVKMTESETTLDAVMNIFYNTHNCLSVHRERLVKFSHVKAIRSITSLMSNKIAEYIHVFETDAPFLSNLRRYKKSLPLEYHINKLIELNIQSNEILVDVQISKARNALIANNIKIHKLSEIHIRNKSDDKQPCAFISKGINDKILSFIV
jgi:hypothetical protein